jgi:hypothetical protein
VILARGWVLLRLVRGLLRWPQAPRLARRGGRIPRLDLGPLRITAGLVLGGQPVPGPGQPLTPLGLPGQRPRRWHPGVLAQLGILGGVDRGRLGEQLLDLRQRPVRDLGRVTSQLGAVQAELAQRHHALRRQQPQHLAEQPTQRRLVPGSEPGNGRMIRTQPGDDHPVGHVAHATLLDHPAGAFPLAVAVQQQRGHHLRVERRPAMPVGPMTTAKLAQIHGGNRIQHNEHQIVLGQPLPHIHRHQQWLITLRVKEVLRHTP